MELRCPACGKQNADNSATVCGRCGADLSMLISILDASGRHLAQAAAQFQARDWAAALWHAERSWKLCHTDRAAQLAFLAAAAVGDSAAALQWLPRARQSHGPTKKTTL